MILQVYTAALSLLLLLFSPVLLPLALIWPRSRKGFLQRFGILPRRTRELMYVGEGSLWVHAASLGELNAITPALRSLLQRLTGVPIIFTCTALAGVEQAQKLFPEAMAHLLLPLDLPVFLKPLFKRYKPRFAIVAETELWPNFLHMLHRSKCQIFLMNGRMTQRSYGRYARLRPLFAASLLCFDTLAIQTEEDAQRFIDLGAKSTRVMVTGNTKFDVLDLAKDARKKGEKLREELGLSAQAPLIVAGSSRPGEEKIFIESFKRLRGRIKGLCLMIAPRHLQRLGEIEGLLKSSGLEYSRRTRGPAKGEVILLDSLGELAAAYSFATLAWIGGSWRHFGGQNPLEASAQGVPVIFGPDMKHFKQPSRVLLESGAAIQVAEEGLAEASYALLSTPAKRKQMGDAAMEAMLRNAGASQRSADLAWKLAVLARLRESERHWRSQSAFASLKVSEFGSTVHVER